MTAETKMVIPAQVMSRQVGDETVILDLGSGMYFGLDPVGARIWQLLSDGRQLDAVVSTLLSEYDVEEDQLRQDVNSLVSELLSRGLIEKRPLR
jgi:hypothetical protein